MNIIPRTDRLHKRDTPDLKRTGIMGWKFSLQLTAVAVATVMAQPQAGACTSLVLRGTDAGVVYGRTMEFGVPLQSAMLYTPGGMANEGIGPDGTSGTGMKWTSKYAIIGANVFGLPFYVDGINEAGLTGGLLNAPNTAEYQQVPPGREADSIAPQQLLTYVLGNFVTVDGAREGLSKILVSNSPMKEWGGVPKARMTLHDARGKSIVVEYIKGELVITDNIIGTMTNDPAFAWHLANIGNYANISGTDKPPIKVGDTTFAAASSGNGMRGLPGSMLSPDRFVRASIFVLNTPGGATTAEQQRRIWHILNNFDIPYGAVHLDASSGYGGGADAYEYTEWTAVANLKDRTYSIRSFESPEVITAGFGDFDPESKESISRDLPK